MQRTKTITYQSCDLCDSPDEAKGKCDICGKWLCSEHYYGQPWADQYYSFCLEHIQLVMSIIKQTGIPIGYVVYKLTPQVPLEYIEKKFKAKGYDRLWKNENEWEIIEYPCCICQSYIDGKCRYEERAKALAPIRLPFLSGCPKISKEE